ncbi:hypothetical protein D3C72_2046300 [compost metagenome]
MQKECDVAMVTIQNPDEFRLQQLRHHVANKFPPLYVVLLLTKHYQWGYVDWKE